MSEIDTAALRAQWSGFQHQSAEHAIIELCDALDATRAALETQRQLHANLLAHLRMEDGR